MNFKERLLHSLLKFSLFSKYRFHFSFDANFDPDRLDPYLLISNHSSLVDGQITVMPLARYPFPVINSFMFRKPFMRFVLTKMIHSIPKRKGQSDILTIRSIMDTIKNDHRGVMLFPEGNASYFGKESPIPFSTAKLLKKLKLDIVVCLVNGGYMSNPRWADRPVRKGLFELHYYTLVKMEDLEHMEVNDLYVKIVEALRFNDFDWNRLARHEYDQRHRAEGLERFIYGCPSCRNTQSIYTKRHQVFCTHCGKIAEFNRFSLLEGVPFDNLVEWDEFQKQLIPEASQKTVRTRGVLEEVDFSGARIRSRTIGKFDIRLENRILSFSSQTDRMDFPLDRLENLTLTRKDELAFDFDGKTYFATIKDPMFFLDAIHYLNGGKE